MINRSTREIRDHGVARIDAGPEQIALWRQAEFYPTPPWAVRGLLNYFKNIGQLDRFLHNRVYTLDPMAGRGHILNPLSESTKYPMGSDLYDYGAQVNGRPVEHGIDFFTHGWAASLLPPHLSCIITNPPFKLAEQTVKHALTLAPYVIILARATFGESRRRFPLIRNHLVLEVRSADRISCLLGQYDPTYSGPTAYSWFIFSAEPKNPTYSYAEHDVATLPPGTKKRFTYDSDALI